MIDAAAIKAQIDIVELVREYAPDLKKTGKDYECCCPFHQEKTPSFKVHESNGTGGWFKCFGCSVGGDIFSFVQMAESTDFKGAVEFLTAKYSLNGHANGNGNGAKPYTPPAERHLELVHPEPPPPPNDPVPEDAPPCRFIHPGMGPPDAAWAYRDIDGRLLGYDARYDEKDKKGRPNGKKKVIPWRYLDEGDGPRWVMRGFTAPTPLYGLEQLKAYPNASIVVTEGCKTCEGAKKIGTISVTWQGGVDAVGKVDFTPLAGRNVVLWPDADSPKKKKVGQNAMLKIGNKLAHIAAKVTYLDVDAGKSEETGIEYPAMCDTKDGWDAADAAEEGWDVDKFIEWGALRRRDVRHQVLEEQVAHTEQKVVKEKAKAERAPLPIPLPYQRLWVEWDLQRATQYGPPVDNLDNVVRVLDNDSRVSGMVYYDTFLNRIWNIPCAREWADEDDIQLCFHMQRNLGIQKMRIETIRKAIILVARKDQRHQVRDWLETLEWDGVERVKTFFPTYFGAKDSPYARAVSRCFLVSLIARAYNPGCKADNMIVLEGPQGLRKSSALEAFITRKWYADIGTSVLNKDFMQDIMGKWFIEIGEMSSFARSELDAVKQMLSRTTDRLRVSYGHYSSDYPRQNIFGGTTNRDNWNRDDTGARRFWPVRCRQIFLDELVKMREQILAEAVNIYKRVAVDASEAERVEFDADWWKTPKAETKEEQDARYDSDPWTEPVGVYIRGLQQVTMSELLTDCLSIDKQRQGPTEQRRVTSILKHLAWTKNMSEKDGTGQLKKIWFPRTDENDL